MAAATQAREQAQDTSLERSKDPFTRLMDLTLSWAEYVGQDEAEHGARVKAGDIYSIYQGVAQFAEPFRDTGPEVQEMAVRHFADTRLLPLLLRKVKL